MFRKERRRFQLSLKKSPPPAPYLTYTHFPRALCRGVGLLPRFKPSFRCFCTWRASFCFLGMEQMGKDADLQFPGSLEPSRLSFPIGARRCPGLWHSCWQRTGDPVHEVPLGKMWGGKVVMVGGASSFAPAPKGLTPFGRTIRGVHTEG